jgi:RNA polymerase sigma factor for flagellar operon FliA
MSHIEQVWISQAAPPREVDLTAARACTVPTPARSREVGGATCALGDAVVRRRVLLGQPLAERIARSVFGRYPRVLELDDLVGAAFLGLVDAALRFEPARGVPFEAFAAARVRGAVLDALRKADWVPTSSRRKRAQLDYARERLVSRLGREPTREELVRALELPAEEAAALRLHAQYGDTISLDAYASPDDLGWEERLADDLPGADELVGERERVDGLLGAIAALPPRERWVLERYHLQEGNLRDVAAELGVTESRVCQLARQAIGRMRGAMIAE